MQMTEPAEWVGKEFIGYMVNTGFSQENLNILVDLVGDINKNYPESFFTVEPELLHITLLDWLAPMYDYDGNSEDELFEELFEKYDKALLGSLEGIKPITVKFDTLNVSASAIFISGKDHGSFDKIRRSFLSKVDLLPGTKMPPTIIHSTIARFLKQEPIENFNSVAKHKINFTQTVDSFRLIRSTKEPMLEYETIKTYKLM